MALYTSFVSACHDGTSCSTLWQFLQAANVCASCPEVVCPLPNELQCPPCTVLDVPRFECPELDCPPCSVVETRPTTVDCPIVECPETLGTTVIAPQVSSADFAGVFSDDLGNRAGCNFEGRDSVVTVLTVVVLLMAVVCFCLSAIIVHLLRGQRKIDPEARNGNQARRSRRRRSKKPRSGGLVIKDFYCKLHKSFY